MVLTIGASAASDFTQPIRLMGECPRRVEWFLGILVKVTAEREGKLLSADEANSMRTALRYFAEAAPKHTADEEESLFPRLRALPHPDSGKIHELIEQLGRDHVLAAESHREVQALGSRWLNAGALSNDEVERLSHRLNALSKIYATHIAAEDERLFPLAETTLDNDQKRQIGKEMAARRGMACCD